MRGKNARELGSDIRKMKEDERKPRISTYYRLRKEYDSSDGHIVVYGFRGTGKHTAIRQLLSEEVSKGLKFGVVFSDMEKRIGYNDNPRIMDYIDRYQIVMVDTGDWDVYGILSQLMKVTNCRVIVCSDNPFRVMAFKSMMESSMHTKESNIKFIQYGHVSFKEQCSLWKDINYMRYLKHESRMGSKWNEVTLGFNTGLIMRNLERAVNDCTQYNISGDIGTRMSKLGAEVIKSTNNVINNDCIYRIYNRLGDSCKDDNIKDIADSVVAKGGIREAWIELNRKPRVNMGIYVGRGDNKCEAKVSDVVHILTESGMAGTKNVIKLDRSMNVIGEETQLMFKFPGIYTNKLLQCAQMLELNREKSNLKPNEVFEVSRIARVRALRLAAINAVLAEGAQEYGEEAVYQIYSSIPDAIEVVLVTPEGLKLYSFESDTRKRRNYELNINTDWAKEYFCRDVLSVDVIQIDDGIPLKDSRVSIESVLKTL